MLWKLWFPLVVLGHFLSTEAQAAAPEIWIAARTDGIAGSGTSSNPYDGHTAALFDGIMRSVASYTTVHLGAGVFETTGSAAITQMVFICRSVAR